MSAVEKTETKYELIMCKPCSDVYSFEGEIRINGKQFGHAYKTSEWVVLIHSENNLGGVGTGKTYFDAVMDAFASCVRNIGEHMRSFSEFTEE